MKIHNSNANDVNLIGYWPINEGTGSSVADIKGGYTGTITTATWVKDKGFYSIYFNKTTDYIHFGNSAFLNVGTNDFTFSTWAKFENETASDYETIGRIGIVATGAGGPGFWAFRYPTSNRLHLSFSDGSATRIQGYMSDTSSLVNNVWTHIAITFDRSGNAEAYINGVKTAYTLNISAQQATINTSSYNLITGGPSSNGRLTGYVNDFMLFNRLLTANEITTLYNSQLLHHQN